MSRSDRADAMMRMEIHNAKKTDTFINRDVIFVLFENEKEKLVHLPHSKYIKFLSNQ